MPMIITTNGGVKTFEHFKQIALPFTSGINHLFSRHALRKARAAANPRSIISDKSEDESSLFDFLLLSTSMITQIIAGVGKQRNAF